MGETRRRLALLLEYDGTPYAGSQLQANGPTIQGELERAIAAMTGAFARVAFAGRTDAGVHALGQVASFDTEAPYTYEAFTGGINVRLPRAIAVRAVREVEPGFDPRRQAIARRYRYSVLTSPVRSPLLQIRAWQVAKDLDLSLMQEAGQCLVGERDFAAFAPPEASRGSTRRRMDEVCIRRCGRNVRIEVEANAFLMHQMRRMVAALVEVGSGRLSPIEFQRHLGLARPGSYEWTAPPHGLCLIHVRYDPPLFASERELC
jgi:tRNA pseudouridine38-40 synthase